SGLEKRGLHTVTAHQRTEVAHRLRILQEGLRLGAVAHTVGIHHGLVQDGGDQGVVGICAVLEEGGVLQTGHARASHRLSEACWWLSTVCKYQYPYAVPTRLAPPRWPRRTPGPRRPRAPVPARPLPAHAYSRPRAAASAAARP